jgi:hypothetical protein
VVSHPVSSRPIPSHPIPLNHIASHRIPSRRITGYAGVLCAVCQPGYHLSTQGCVACSSGSTQYSLFIVIALVVVFIVATYYVAQRVDTKKMVNAAAVLVSYFQVAGSAGQKYNIPWPAFMESVLAQFRLALLDFFSVTAVDCYTTFSFYLPFWITLTATSGLLILAAVFHKVLPFLFATCCSAADPTWPKYLRSLIVKSAAIFLTVLYPAISLQSLSLWSCQQVGAHRYLISDFSVRCEGDDYWWASFANIFFVVGIVLGWPAFLLWYLRRVEKQGRVYDPIVENRIGFLYRKYKPGACVCCGREGG